MPKLDHSEHFSREELQCPHCGECEIEAMSLARLEQVRVAFNRPLHLSSAYRCPDHNEAVSSSGRDGPHVLGQAFDVLIHGPDAWRLVWFSMAHSFEGIGVNQRGPHSRRFVHLDDCTHLAGRPRPVLWSY